MLEEDVGDVQLSLEGQMSLRRTASVSYETPLKFFNIALLIKDAKTMSQVAINSTALNC